MKVCSFLSVAAASIATLLQGALLAENLAPFVYETPHEFFGSGDFHGDGRMDLVIVDKESGKYRLAYQLSAGVFTWVDCRPSGIKGLTGFTIGRFLPPKADGLAFTSPNGTEIALADVSNPTASRKAVMVTFSSALGPNTLIATMVGGTGHGDLADLFVGSIFNSPDANLETLLRNDAAQFPKIAETPLPGTPGRGNGLKLSRAEAPMVCFLVTEDKGDSLRVEEFGTGRPVLAASATGMPAGSDYAIGHFRSGTATEFLLYKPGANSLECRVLEQAGQGQFQFGKGATFDLGQAGRRVITLGTSSPQRLFVIFGEGEKGGVFKFEGVKAPELLQTLYATNSLFTCALPVTDGFMTFAQTSDGKFSTKYQVFHEASGTYASTIFGGLPSLADNDNVTIPDIQARIVANATVKTQSEMKPYTNMIPGTGIKYAMVPIPGGEFVMGSPKTEAGRKPDEGPQHKVKIAPFWMGQYEVTWAEYELFMFPDEEKRTRMTVPTDAGGDKLGDAVTHPSRPYVEMSFGMGKDGFPAISMTQHGANKYCQWLSAKTGHFYRLPTEAEWEYAARAGTTTPYFFGNDRKKLGEYAWFEENSEFKYQKVGKKKPNPWGLYDIYGNVMEWVLDQYDPNFYQQCAGNGVTVEPWNKATKPYPHSARG